MAEPVAEDGPGAVVTEAEYEAARAFMNAYRENTAELDRLSQQEDRAVSDATIALVVGIDMACASGLRRKTRTGYDVTPRAPKAELQKVGRLLTEWYEAKAAARAPVDAHLAKMEANREQMRAHSEAYGRSAWDTIGAWQHQQSQP